MSDAPPVVKERKRRARAEDAPDRRQDLLVATVNCLARLGPWGTTGREVCRQAGVSHGLLRHYFRNPKNLLLETYEQLCEQLLAELEAQSDAHGDDPGEALHHFFATIFSEQWASPEIIGAWMVFWQLARNREDFAAVSSDFNLRQRVLLEKLLRRLPQNRGSLSMTDAIAILSAAIDGLWIELYLSEERTPVERCIALSKETVGRLFGR